MVKVKGNSLGKFSHKRAAFLSDWVDKRKREWRKLFGNGRCKSRFDLIKEYEEKYSFN